MSVYGTVSRRTSLRGFSRQHGLNHFCLMTRHHLSALTKTRICLSLPPTGLNRDIQRPDGLPFCVPPSLRRFSSRYRTINLFPIDYAFLPRLRGRLTLGRLTLPRKPWVYGERVSHPFYRYSCQHNHFSQVQHTFRCTFVPYENAPLPRVRVRVRGFGIVLSPVTFSAQNH